MTIVITAAYSLMLFCCFIVHALIKILSVLSATFIAYTASVYFYCDPRADVSKPSSAALGGLKVWQEHNCQSCHQMYGLGGYLGPDLTNAVSVKNKDYLRVMLQYGSGRMPNFHLKDEEVENLLAFLSWVDKSGRSKVSDTAVQWDGNYKLSSK